MPLPFLALRSPRHARLLAVLLAVAVLPGVAAYHTLIGGTAPELPAPGFDLSDGLTIDAVPRGALLEWDAAPAPGVMGYQVWRSTGDWVNLGEASGLTRFLDRNPPAGAAYKVTYFTGKTLIEGYAAGAQELGLLAGWRDDLHVVFDPAQPTSAPAGPRTDGVNAAERAPPAALPFILLAAAFVLAGLVLPFAGRPRALRHRPTRAAAAGRRKP